MCAVLLHWVYRQYVIPCAFTGSPREVLQSMGRARKSITGMVFASLDRNNSEPKPIDVDLDDLYEKQVRVLEIQRLELQKRHQSSYERELFDGSMYTKTRSRRSFVFL